MTQSFVNGCSLPGEAFFSGEALWVAGEEALGARGCERAHQARSLGIRTLVCVPVRGGVVELGSTDVVRYTAEMITKIAGFFSGGSAGNRRLLVDEFKSDPTKIWGLEHQFSSTQFDFDELGAIRAKESSKGAQIGVESVDRDQEVTAAGAGDSDKSELESRPAPPPTAAVERRPRKRGRILERCVKVKRSREGYGTEDGIFCGVFDGHGRHGHMISKLVRDTLPRLLLRHRKAHLLAHDCGNTDHDTDYDDDAEGSLESASSLEVFDEWKDACISAFKAVDKELRKRDYLDCSYSGSTAVTVIKQGRDLIISNLGDSRAVLGTLDEDGKLMAVQLTTDLKPSVPHEAERIKKKQGRVFALRDEPNIQRVWLPNDNYPGLAMARAFGDFQLKRYGVIAVPQVSYRSAKPQDQFLVLATDGVWDVLSNDEVVSIVWSARSKEIAARAVVAAAVRAWKQNFPSSLVDDCTVVCLSLQEDNHDFNVASVDDEYSSR